MSENIMICVWYQIQMSENIMICVWYQINSKNGGISIRCVLTVFIFVNVAIC